MIRIYTRIVLDMTQDDIPVIESESFLHDGPVDLCMPSDGGRESGDGDRGSGGSSDSERGGRSGEGGDFGGMDYGGGMGSMGGFAEANQAAAQAGAEAAARGMSGMDGNGFGGNAGLNGPNDVPGSIAQRDMLGQAPMSGYETMSGIDFSGAFEQVGVKATKGPGGYYNEKGQKVGYSSGSPTSYGAADAGQAMGGMSWQGSSAINDAVTDAKSTNRQAVAREVTAKALTRTRASSLDPAQKKAIEDSINTGVLGKAVEAGMMSTVEAKAVANAYSSPMEHIGSMMGFDDPADLTTPFEKHAAAVKGGLVDPTTGALTTKGWMNVASPALGMLAGPLAGLGMSIAGIPGAIAGALAPSVASTVAKSDVPGARAAQAVSTLGKSVGVDLGPAAMGLSFAKSMDTMSGAQAHMGMQPDGVSGIEGQHGDGRGFNPSSYAQFFKGSKTPSLTNAARGTSYDGVLGGKSTPDFGQRVDGTQKGLGWQGEIPTDDGKVMTEVAIGVNVDGQEMQIPLIVKSTTDAELALLKANKPPTRAMIKKAIDSAMKRKAEDKSPFAGNEESGFNPGSYSMFFKKKGV